MTEKPMIDTSIALTMLDAIHANSEGMVTLASLPQLRVAVEDLPQHEVTLIDGKLQRRWYQTYYFPANLADALTQVGGHWMAGATTREMYFSPGSFKPIDAEARPQLRSKRQKANASEKIWAVWGDNDVNHVEFPGEDAMNEALQWLYDLGAFIWNSGSGRNFQYVIPLAAPIDGVKLQMINRALAEKFAHLGGDKAVTHAAAVLRLPGSFNNKREEPSQATPIAAPAPDFERVSAEYMIKALGIDEKKAQKPSSGVFKASLDPKGTQYGIGALNGILGRLVAVPAGAGQRNQEIYKAGAAVGNYVAGGELSDGFAREELIRAAEQLGNSKGNAATVALRGYEAGLNSPMQAPKRDEDYKRASTEAPNNARKATENTVEDFTPLFSFDGTANPTPEGSTNDEVLSFTLEDAMSETMVPHPSKPQKVARHLLENGWLVENTPILRRWNDTWYGWTQTHWDVLSKDHVQGLIYRRLEDAKYEERGEDTVKRKDWNPNTARVNDVANSLKSLTTIADSLTDGSWTGEQGEHPDRLVAFTNGLLDAVERKLHPHNPRYFNTNSLPFAYDENATECPNWIEFLNNVWGNDDAARALLQEWFGYIISGRTDLQKMFVLIGPPRSGKGTIARVLSALIGSANIASPTMSSLVSDFGLGPLIGKSMAIIPDARMPKQGGETVVERLLSITGEDYLDVNRKYQSIWTGKLTSRMMLLSNEIPSLLDSSGAINNRMLLLTMTQSFLGKEDHTLEQRLLKELPAILNWALDGLDRLVARNRFTEPESSKTLVEMAADVASPISKFLKDKCVIRPEVYTPCARLFKHWQDWCAIEGHHPGAQNKFGVKLMAAVPGLKKTQKMTDGVRTTFYGGVGIAA